MTDRREQILSRLVEVCRTVVGQDRVARNKTDVSGKNRPAIVVLDADESADPRGWDRGRPASSPNLVNLNPEVYLLVWAKTGAAQAQRPEDTIGPDLNQLRAQLLKAVLEDDQLIAACSTNGEIRYDGCVTDLARGRSMEGEMVVNFTFRYVLKPTDL